MRKLSLGLIAAFLFLCATPARAQVTVVNGTVTDPNGLPYSYASIQVQQVPGGAPYSAGNADVNGTFSITLTSATYNFTVSESPGVGPPLGYGPQTFTV